MNALRVPGVWVLVLTATAQAEVFTFTATLSGANVIPPNNSPGTGLATVSWNTSLHTMRVRAVFSGLDGVTIAAHIHAPTAIPLAGMAGVATQSPSFLGFPLGVTSGTMDQTFSLTLASTYSSAFLAANGGTPSSAETALFTFIVSGRAYFDIHTLAYNSGEIRGFLVPAPGATILLGVMGWHVAGRRRDASW